MIIKIYKVFNIVCFLIFLLVLNNQLLTAQNGEEWITFNPDEYGNGQYIVLISGDEEYRSEEALPMLAKILTTHHGFKTTVLFAIDPETGKIDPNNQINIPGMKKLKSADLMVIFTRFRELSDEQMKYFDEYLQLGKPIVALRTATHAFNYSRNETSPYAKYSFRSEVPGWDGGFGRQILGETWINHHGRHGSEGTRGLIDGTMERNDHPIIRGIKDIWGPTDVYGTRVIKGDVDILLWGASTNGMTPDAPVNWSKSIMPIAWTKTYTSENGINGRVFTTTMGSSVDFESEDLRRLLINACYWSLEMEDDIPEKSNVDYVGEYNPTMFGVEDYIQGQFPKNYK